MITLREWGIYCQLYQLLFLVSMKKHVLKEPFTTYFGLIRIIDYLIKKSKINKNSFLYLIDDGSTDRTWEIIEKEYKQNKNIKALKFLKNNWTQNALYVGYSQSNIMNCDCVVSIDVDLEQDENTIEQLLDKYVNGSDVVFAVKKDRKTDSFFKKISVMMFYKLIKLFGVNVIENNADYRLVSKYAISVLQSFSENDMFLRIFFNNIWLKKDLLYFDVKSSKRKSKFTFKKLFVIAVKGITSITFTPLRLIFGIGLIFFVIGIIGMVIFVFLNLFKDNITVYIKLFVFITILFSINIFCLGIISLYIEKIISEVFNRPKYIKEKELN